MRQEELRTVRKPPQVHTEIQQDTTEDQACIEKQAQRQGALVCIDQLANHMSATKKQENIHLVLEWLGPASARVTGAACPISRDNRWANGRFRRGHAFKYSLPGEMQMLLVLVRLTTLKSRPNW